MLKKPPQARSPSKTEERRRDRVRQAIETDGFSDDYLTSVIHDLRGSLNGIVGWAELLRRNALPGEGQVRAGEAIIRQSARQLELINEVGDVWRLLSGNLQLKLGPVDAKELVQEAVAAVTESQEKSVRFSLKLEALSKPLLADAARIRQALIGLLRNAIHFTPERGTIEVRLKAAERGGAELTVHDQGPRIELAALPYLFERRREADPAKNCPRSTFGRGLSLVRDIIDLHGGTVSADNHDEPGVTFHVTLPIESAPGVTRRDIRSSEVTPSSQPDTRKRLAHTSVLIVDDDPDAREVVAAILRHFGASVIVATSVSTAMDALRREHVDVLLADLGMPVEDGFELVRQIRGAKSEAIARTPVAALTAYTTESDRRRALAAGFQVHLAKPIDPALLVTTIERLRTGMAL